MNDFFSRSVIHLVVRTNRIQLNTYMESMQATTLHMYM